MKRPSPRSVLTHGLCSLVAPIAYELVLHALGRNSFDSDYRKEHHR